MVLFDCKKYPKTWGVSDSPQTPTNEQGTPLHPSGTAYELAQVKEIENKNGLILFLIYFTQANVPQITRHLAVCRQFNFNYDIFVVYIGKNKAFAKILFLPRE